MSSAILFENSALENRQNWLWQQSPIPLPSPPIPQLTDSFTHKLIMRLFPKTCHVALHLSLRAATVELGTFRQRSPHADDFLHELRPVQAGEFHTNPPPRHQVRLPGRTRRASSFNVARAEAVLLFIQRDGRCRCIPQGCQPGVDQRFIGGIQRGASNSSVRQMSSCAARKSGRAVRGELH